MILTPQQILIAEQGGDIDSLPLGKRDATIGKQWPKGVVVYKISSSLGMSDLETADNNYIGE